MKFSFSVLIIISIIILISIFSSSFKQVNGQILLTLGTPIISNVSYGQNIVYTVHPVNLNESQALTFTLTPFDGDADLFASSNPDVGPANYFWNSSSTSFDTISITRTTPEYTPVTTWYVSVYGYQATAQFTLLAHVTNSGILNTVMDGIPMYDSCQTGSSGEFFVFNLPLPANLTFSVTPIDGDPDLYISTSFKYPNSNDNTWSSQTFGYDMVQVNTNDPNFVTNANYYIGISCFLTSRFTFTLSRTTSSVQLIQDVPNIRNVMSGSYSFYKFYVPSSTSLTVSVTLLGNTEGDPDLYISRTNQRPSRTSYTWSSLNFGSDVITILSTDPNAGAGWYYVAVYGYSSTIFEMEYNVIGDNVILSDGVPQNGQGAIGQINYYKFYNSDPSLAITINADIINSGRIRMLTSTSNPNPTYVSGKYDNQSVSIGGSAFLTFPPQTHVGWYYIGIQHLFVGAITNFTITVSTNTTSTVLLPNQLIMFNQVGMGQYSYFVFSNQNPGQDITITVSPWVGDPDLYISTQYSHPSASNNQWYSTRSGVDSVTIFASDPHYLPNPGDYYIAVYGFVYSNFAIGVFISGATVSLDEGVQTPGQVFQGLYNYYSFNLLFQTTLTFEMHLDNDVLSDADIYVSMTNSKPNSISSTWSSVSIGNDLVTIQNARPGTYYIGVYGQTNATYTILANAGAAYLQEGNQLLDSVQEHQYRHYQFPMDPVWAPFVLVSVTLINGYTQLYGSNNGNLIWPNSTSYTWSSTTFPGQVLLLEKGQPGYPQNATELVFGVLGMQDSDYLISVQVFNALLESGVPMMGSASFTNYTRYKFYIEFTGTVGATPDHEISIRVISGTLSLFASQINQEPENNFQYSAIDANIDTVIYISGSDLASGYFFISVIGVQEQENSPYPTFMTTMSPITEPILLTQDQNMVQTTKASGSSFFSVYTFDQSSTMSIYVDSCTNTVGNQFYVSNFTSTPSENDNILKSNYNAYTLSLTAAVAPQTVYYVGLYTLESDFTYSIYASTRLDQRPVPGNNGLVDVYPADFGSVGVSVSGANSAGLYYPYVYQAYYIAVNPSQVDTTNMHTVCSIKKNSIKLGGAVTAEDGMSNSNIELIGTIPYSGNDYLVNVIVTDGLGLETAYSPIFVPSNTIPHRHLFFSFGLLFLILLVVIDILYLLIGTIVNLIRKKKGVHIIPNYIFWKSLPGLVWDGMVFVFTGFGLVKVKKQASSYSTNSPANTTTIPGFAPPSTSTSGYGAL